MKRGWMTTTSVECDDVREGCTIQIAVDNHSMHVSEIYT